MKILYLSKAPLPSHKSSSLSIMRMAQAFADCGNEVILTGIADSNNLTDPIEHYGLKGGFRVIRYKLNTFTNTKFAQLFQLAGLYISWRNRSIIRKFQPDIIYSRLTLSELALLPCKIPIVYEMHSLGFIGKSRFEKWLFTTLLKYKNFQRIIVTTNMLATMLRNYFTKSEIKVARLSADVPIELSPKDIEDFKNEELEGKHFLNHVGYTGNLDKIGLRGTDTILEVASKMPETGFHIVGGADSVVEYWQNIAVKYNYHQNIFFYGFQSPKKIPFYLNCFDVVLAPLKYRPNKRAPAGHGMSPLKISQYLSYSQAIVASDIPSHREILEDGKTALLVDSENPDAWVEAIRLYLSDKELQSRIRINGYKHYRNEFTPRVRVERILAGFS